MAEIKSSEVVHHGPNKYYGTDYEPSHAAMLTQKKLSAGKDLDGHDVEELCSKFLMNQTYYNLATNGERDKALTTAARVIVDHGRDIKNQLDANDKEMEGKNIGSVSDVLGDKSQEVLASSNQNIQPEKGEKSDIPKISGGT